ncbi:MAG: hypothetical protein JWO69_109 [Thermoleophilia bacterium]|jgi:sulfatase modifying factor 1|nr:hypothetical protein [Thermoleophilia bacterium]
MPDEPRMVEVPAGEVTLSDRRTEQRWTVAVEPFLLGAVPVTQAMYAATMGEVPSTQRGDELPVETVSWLDAVQFCNALSHHAGHTPAYALIADDDIAWHRGNSGGAVHSVGTREPNAWGLHDMLGNVWEWCWDIYDREVYGSYRVLRGGGWSDERWSCRASVRRRSHPTFAIDDVGFRVAGFVGTR